MQKTLGLAVRLGELGVGNVAVPVPGDAGNAPEQEDRAEADQRDEIRRPSCLPPARYREAIFHGARRHARHAPRALGGPHGRLLMNADLDRARPGARLAIDARLTVPNDPLRT